MTIRLKDNLRRLLMARGIRAADLARQTGIAPSVLSEWMSGRMPRNLAHLWKVARQLGVSLDDLCFEDTEALLQKGAFPGGLSPAPAETANLESLLKLFPITLHLCDGREIRVLLLPPPLAVTEPEPAPPPPPSSTLEENR
jgi:transcriptional regulator with XRE-family HTH domain